MSRITNESIERVRSTAEIVDVVSGHSDLRRVGGRFTGLCPFHDERTPSFSVDPVKGLYHCFGCGVGGDVFKFVQEKEALDFPEAVEQLAERYGVELSYDESDPAAEQRRRERERLYELVAKTAGFFERYFGESKEAAPARAYLESRGLGREILAEFGVGYAPSAWDRVLTRALESGYSEDELLAAGLAQRGRQGGVYDRFRGRIMFPLRDERGRVRGFGARAASEGQQPKYVNSPESDVYHKGGSLFGIDLARAAATRAGEVIVVEGYTDAIALHQAGIRNVVAAMGTALTDEQVAALARLARVVILAFDADASGQEAMLRVHRAAAGRGIDLKVVRLPDDKDPCDLLSEAGPDGFAKRAGEATSFLEFQVAIALEGADTSSAAGKDRVVEQLAPVFAELAPSAERDEQIRRVASQLQLDEHWLTPALARHRASAGTTSAPTAPQTAASRFERSERIFLAMCVSSGGSGREYLERLSDDHLSSELLGRARAWLVEHFDEPTEGLGGDEELARVVSEIVVRASSQPADVRALEVGFLGLEQRRLDRETKVAAEAGDFERQRELSMERSETTEAIAMLMGGASAPSIPGTGHSGSG
ncbi:MAG: DNA primase [Solirubrobacterales bacterium]